MLLSGSRPPFGRLVVNAAVGIYVGFVWGPDIGFFLMTGLIAAVRKYDPEQGSTFAAYATVRIRGAILDELRRMDWCPRRARARARKMKEAINVLEQKLGRVAPPR